VRTSPTQRNHAPGAGARRARASAQSGAAPQEPLTAGFIRSYALYWVLGLGFLWWPMLLLRALRARTRGTAAHFLPSAVVVCLSLSLLWAAVAGASLSRVVSASYNISIWVALAVLTTVRIDPRALLRGLAQLAGIQSVAVLAALGLYPLLDGAPLPSSFFLPAALAQDPAFESFTTVRLVVPDYFGGAVLRTAGFFGNSTWAGALAALGILASIHLVRWSQGGVRAIYSAMLVLDVVVLYLSYSRNTWVALLAALLAMAVVTQVRRRQWFGLLVTVTFGAGALLYVLTSVDLAATFDEVNSVREGSLDSRTAIYQATWKAIQESPFPLIGSGVKERVPGLVASLGTHSGYLGILYRGGWLALAALVAWLIVLGWRSLRAWSPLAVGNSVLAAIWFIAEDIDAGHLAPLALVVAFVMVRPHPSPESSKAGAPHSP
jgi:O-antigen ligase